MQKQKQKQKQELIDIYETLGKEITYGYCVASDFKYQKSAEPNAKELSTFYSAIWRCLRVGFTLNEAIRYFETGDFELKEWEVFATYSDDMVWGYSVRVWVGLEPQLVFGNGKPVFSIAKAVAEMEAKMLYKERRIERANFEVAKKFLNNQK